MDFKLELVIVPVSDVDRAKAFYTERCGFHLDVDHRAGPEFRVVQMTPPGSACSMTIMAPPSDCIGPIGDEQLEQRDPALLGDLVRHHGHSSLVDGPFVPG